MIDLAMDAVEERIRSGKASASEYVHFLKLGTEQAKLEREKLKKENQLLEAKAQSITESADIRKMIDDAMAAFALYSGNVDYEDDEDEDEEERTSSRRRRRRR
jgi:conjugal transfer/entry exclusion protein